MTELGREPTDLVLVMDRADRGAALKARVDRIGMPIEELARKVGLSREQLGKILNDKVPQSRSFGKIERALDEIELEHGRAPTHTATSSGQIEIEAEGVFGISRIVVRGEPIDAEESFARIVDRLKRDDDSET